MDDDNLDEKIEGVALIGEWRTYDIPMQRLCREHVNREEFIEKRAQEKLKGLGTNYCVVEESSHRIYYNTSEGRVFACKYSGPPKFKEGYATTESVKQHLRPFQNLDELLNWMGMKRVNIKANRDEKGIKKWSDRFFAVVTHYKLQELASMAEDEDWGAPQYYGLENYLRYTFLRMTEPKSSSSDVSFTPIGFFPEDSSSPVLVCFHTGLLTKDISSIYAILVPSSQSDEEPWILHSFKTQAHLTHKYRMLRYGAPPIPKSKLPEKAFYYEDPSKAVYNQRITIDKDTESVDWNHLLSPKIRFRLPEKYWAIEPEVLQQRLMVQLAYSEIRAKHNPRCAVPQYFWDDKAAQGELQLLLPVSLDEKRGAMPDCSVAVILHEERIGQKVFATYRPVSILSLEMAYMNARLIQKIDQGWMKNFMKTSNTLEEESLDSLNKDNNSFYSKDDNKYRPSFGPNKWLAKEDTNSTARPENGASDLPFKSLIISPYKPLESTYKSSEIVSRAPGTFKSPTESTYKSSLESTFKSSETTSRAPGIPFKSPTESTFKPSETVSRAPGIPFKSPIESTFKPSETVSRAPGIPFKSPLEQTYRTELSFKPTVRCRHWARGHCIRGKDCNFLHD